MIDLKKIKEDTDASIVVLADKTGNIVDSVGTEYESNVALMLEAAFTMCNDLSKDLLNGDLDQLMAKCSQGYFIANKINPDSIILIVTNDLSKLGLLLKYMSALNN
ncbi:hypothetical protein [Aquimarina muelleri]|uniref:Roadblock/LAMTOR2 domain-containing protein n=1 Tax=Aquimarina muelleri TaxID=279356 RepID=A0A918JW48_9FLAO|nr:hypothetical protein [Aquimarina muelleri]MCX2762487.1 hypothetical protein [Aquimarina muelleri]GGX20504.1 hypothetical protein GCM10007384_22300 [Aquimarina muelleri]